MSMQSNPRKDSVAWQGMPVGDPFEEHYSLQEIAQKWGVDYETVRKEFIDREGVLILGDQERKDGKRAYLTIRVPRSLLEQVYRERTTRKFYAPRRPRTTAAPDGKGPKDSKFPRRAKRRCSPEEPQDGKTGESMTPDRRIKEGIKRESG
jgi:hypothetical protein